MKTRKGFVSNSSSSSFIVGFDKVPETSDDLGKMMFSTNQGILITEYCGEMLIPDIIERVFNDLKNATPLTETEIVEEIKSGHFDGAPSFWENVERNNNTREIEKEFCDLYNKDLSNPHKKIHSMNEDCSYNHPKYKEYLKRWNDEWNRIHEIEQKIWNAAAIKYFNSVKHKFQGRKNYKFEYSDNSGEETLEHGNIFRRLPHIQISHH